MKLYEKMYYQLFNAVTDALNALERRNYGQAEEILKAAQQEGEEIYLAQPQKTKKASDS